MGWIRERAGRWHLEEQDPRQAATDVVSAACGIDLTTTGPLDRAEGDAVPLYQRCPGCAALARERHERAPAATRL